MTDRRMLENELAQIKRERAARYSHRQFTDEHFDYLRSSARRIREIRKQILEMGEEESDDD